MMDRSRCISMLKTTVIEFIEDIEANIARGMLEKKVCQVFLAHFRSYPELKLMNSCVKLILPKAKEMKERQLQFLETSLETLFKKITDHDFPLEITKDRLSKEDEETIWNFMDIILALTEQYKKDQ